jgi:hypothetical protein
LLFLSAFLLHLSSLYALQRLLLPTTLLSLLSHCRLFLASFAQNISRLLYSMRLLYERFLFFISAAPHFSPVYFFPFPFL